MNEVTIIVIVISFALLMCSVYVLSNSTLVPMPDPSLTPMPIQDSALARTSSPSKLWDREEMPEVTIKTEYDEYPTGVADIKVYWTNESQHFGIEYGEYYELYKMGANEWTQIKECIIIYPAVAYCVPSGETVEKTYWIMEWFGWLDPGEYRIYAGFTTDGITEYVAATGFTVI